MPDWLSFIFNMWPIVSAVAPFLFMGVLYWMQQKFPTKADFEKLAATVVTLTSKLESLDGDQKKTSEAVKGLKQDQDNPPTRLHLLEEVGGLAERLGAVEAHQKGIGKQLDTTNGYLKLLIENGVR